MILKHDCVLVQKEATRAFHLFFFNTSEGMKTLESGSVDLNWASVVVTFVDLSELLYLTTWTPKDQPPRIYC